MEEEEEYYDDDLDLDVNKLVSVLRALSPEDQGKQPDQASGGPRQTKKKRWVKKKVRRRKKEATAIEQDVVPPPPRLAISSHNSSVSSSPLAMRKEPGVLKKPPPPPPPSASPAVPDYPHEDVTPQLVQKMREISELMMKTKELHEGYKQIDKELKLKIDALNQLVEMKTKM
jgi:hypothetical protein